MSINADNLNSVIEFDSPFTVLEGGNVLYPLHSIYAPSVEHRESEDIYIDSNEWEAFSVGYSAQDRYYGPVMHASEQLSGALALDILAQPGTYVVTTVEVNCDTDSPECYDGDIGYRIDSGCDCAPAGWVVLKHKLG